MLRAFFSSATGMRAQEVLIDNTANNLANVNTNGFKRQEVNFADLHYDTSQAAGSSVASGQLTPVGLQIGSGVRVLNTTKAFTQGVLRETGIETDVAIEGNGFFQVTLPSGDLRLTRDGSFRINNTGQLVNSDGFVVTGGVTIPDGAKNIRVGVDGTVEADVNGTRQELGTIQVFRVLNPMGLSNEGGNLYSVTPASGEAQQGTPGTDVGSVRQSFVESSNVEVVRELVSLITAQRAYEVNSRAIRAGDEMLSNTAQIIR